MGARRLELLVCARGTESEAVRTEEVRREVHRPVNLQDQKRVESRAGSLFR
jgi:hypothetical protein